MISESPHVCGEVCVKRYTESREVLLVICVYAKMYRQTNCFYHNNLSSFVHNFKAIDIVISTVWRKMSTMQEKISNGLISMNI